MLPAELLDIACRWQELSSYSGLHHATARVFYPDGLSQLVRLLAHARAHSLAVTVHGGGLSLSDQAIGRGVVVSLRAFQSITVDAIAAEVTAEAGARWADVLPALPPGLLPAIVVTCGEATVGGTFSANSLSRFSPGFGRESDSVVAFDLLLADGTVRHCRRDNEHRYLFAAAGGFGFLGIVLRVRYRLLDLRQLVPASSGRAVDTMSVQTVTKRHPRFASLGHGFLRLKQRVDPQGLFRNDFFDRVFARVASAPAPAASGSPAAAGARPAARR